MPQKRISSRMKKKQEGNKPLYISERVQAVRDQLGITLKEVADLLGVTAPAVGQAERNNTGLLFEIIILFGKKFNINPAWVLLEDNSKVPQLVDRSGPSDAPGPAHAENLTADQLATRIRRDVLKLKELVEEETLKKSKSQKGKK